MYLFHQRWRKTPPAAQHQAQAGVDADTAWTARFEEAIRFEDLETLRDAAPLIGLNKVDIRVIEVLAAAAKSSLNGLCARISDGWLASATGLDPQTLSLSLGRLSVVKLVNLPQPCDLAIRGRANRKAYDLSPLMQRLPELEWLLEAAGRTSDEGALPDCTPDSFRAILEQDDEPQGGEPDAGAVPGFLGSWSAASQPVDADADPVRSFPRKAAAPRRGLMRQALSKRLAPRRTPRAVRSGRCPSPAAASTTLRKRQPATAAPSSQSLSSRVLNELQAWQKALGEVLGIVRPEPAPAFARPALAAMPRPSAYSRVYNDAYWTTWNEEKNHTYS